MEAFNILLMALSVGVAVNLLAGGAAFLEMISTVPLPAIAIVMFTSFLASPVTLLAICYLKSQPERRRFDREYP